MKRRQIIRHVLPLALLTALLPATLAPAASPQPDTAAATPAVRLDDFVAQIAALRSVRLEARAVIRLETPQGVRTGEGTFLYEEHGDLFRIRCQTDRALGLMDDVEYVFDGERSLVWLLASNTVTANTSFLDEAPTALPNPFFLPVEHMVDLQACPQCRVSLERLRTAHHSGQAVLPDRRPGAEQRRLITSPERRRTDADLSLGREAGLVVPERIVRKVPTRDGELSIELRDYRSVDGFVFPRAMTLETVDREARTALRMELAITRVEVDVPLGRESFAAVGDENTTFILSGDPARDVRAP